MLITLGGRKGVESARHYVLKSLRLYMFITWRGREGGEVLGIRDRVLNSVSAIMPRPMWHKMLFVDIQGMPELVTVPGKPVTQ